MIQISIIIMSAGNHALVRIGEDVRAHPMKKEFEMETEIFALLSKYVEMVDERDQESKPEAKP